MESQTNPFPSHQKLSVIVPVFNEKATIENLINDVLSVDCIELEVIVIDDHSTDGTREVLEKLVQPKVSKIIYHSENQGKGAAIRAGIQVATGDYLIFQDADLEYNPMEYPVLLSPLLKGIADVVYGSRFLTTQEHRVLYYWHSVGNRFLTFLSNVFSNLNLTDMETCYKAFRMDIIKQISIEESRFGMEPEITAKISKIPDIRIYEVGISYHGRTYTEGKKINWKDGMRAIWCIIKYNLFR